jgi:hypothetical protein
VAGDGEGRAFRPGDEVVWREVWRGTAWLEHRVRVVCDTPELLAVHTPEGTRFESPPGSWPWGGAHPWTLGTGRWEGHGPLILHRPGDAFTVWAMWRGPGGEAPPIRRTRGDGVENALPPCCPPGRTFAQWYVNFQEAPRRTADGFDTYDQELDIVLQPDGSWRLKDDELMDPWVERGRFTPVEVETIRAEAARVGEALDRGERWWDEAWADWEPDPSWRVP